MFSAALTIISVVLLVLLLTRAIQGGFVSRLPFFYSYIVFILAHTGVQVVLLLFFPRYRPAVFWFGFAISAIVEFAVLIEISDHMFERYLAIRKLGRFACFSLTIFFALVYILPAFLETSSRSAMTLNLVKRASLTKVVIVLALLVAKRAYGLNLGRSMAGILLGFSLYLGVNVANFALAERLGQALYAPIFAWVGPVSWTLGSLVWVVALWRYEPAAKVSREVPVGKRETSPPVYAQLGRFNDTLLRLLQK